METSIFDEIVALLEKEENGDQITTLCIQLIALLKREEDRYSGVMSELLCRDGIDSRIKEEMITLLYDMDYSLENPALCNAVQYNLFDEDLEVAIMSVFCLVHCCTYGIDMVWFALDADTKPEHHEVIFSLLWSLIL